MKNLFLGAASLATGLLLGTLLKGQSEYRNDCQYKSKAHQYMQRLSDRIDGVDLEFSMIKALIGYKETLSPKQDSMVPEGLRLYDLSIDLGTGQKRTMPLYRKEPIHNERPPIEEEK